MTDLSLEISRHLPHPPEKVFDAWLDPDLLGRFMIPGPGMKVGETRTDPRVGGAFLITMQAPEAGDIPHTGEYIVIDRANQLQFTWISPFSPDASTVTLMFAPKDGGTDLVLTHTRFPNEESRDNHHGGWTMILNALETAL